MQAKVFLIFSGAILFMASGIAEGLSVSFSDGSRYTFGWKKSGDDVWPAMVRVPPRIVPMRAYLGSIRPALPVAFGKYIDLNYVLYRCTQQRSRQLARRIHGKSKYTAPKHCNYIKRTGPGGLTLKQCRIKAIALFKEEIRKKRGY